MDNDGSNSERHLQALPQLQATGAEVVGSDGETVGDLGEVRDDEFTVTGRGLFKGNLNIPVSRIRGISSDDKITLDVPASEAKDIGHGGSPSKGDPHADFSENVKTERGAWGLSRDE